jgi:hypothetical protein
MPDPDDALLRKDFKLELSKFRTKTKPTLAEALALRMELIDLKKMKDADEKRLKEIDLGLKKLNLAYLNDVESLESRVNKMLKGKTVTAKDSRGLAKWYADIVDKESGLDLGNDLKLWGDMDFGDMEFKLILKGKFSNP